MGKLVLMVGLPRSGKSTEARALHDLLGYPIVNPDSVRLALHGQPWYAPAEPMVWAISEIMVEALFKAGHKAVILDATNVLRNKREIWYRRYGVENILIKEVKTSKEECLRRAISNNQQVLIPVIERMSASWEKDTEDGRYLPMVIDAEMARNVDMARSFYDKAI